MTALVSVIPILLLIILMMGFKVSGYKSAIVTLLVTIVLALFAVPAMGIIPEKYSGLSIYGISLWSVIEGFLKACFPIILIIICAIYSYNILCETKEIETIKTQFIQMTRRRARGHGRFRHRRGHPRSHPHRTGIQAYVLSCHLSDCQHRGRGLRCRRTSRHHAGQPGSCRGSSLARDALRGGHLHHPPARPHVLHHPVPHPHDDRPPSCSTSPRSSSS